MTETYERGQDTSSELTEVRTVLSRAENALETVERRIVRGDYRTDWGHGYCEDRQTCTDEAHWHRTDPDAQDMAEALANVVRLLDRWRRTGATRRDRAGRRR